MISGVHGASGPERTAAVLVVTLPLKLRNPLNAQITNSVRAAMAYRSERKREHKCAARMVREAMLAGGLRSVDLVPCAVTLTRVAVGRIDDDGWVASCKWVRDGIAEALGVDDGGRFIKFRYGTRKGRRGAYAVEVRIEAQR